MGSRKGGDEGAITEVGILSISDDEGGEIMKHIDLEQFAGGELTAQVNRELETVTRNIQDPNTEAKKSPQDHSIYHDQAK